jgi:hypothetical protein
MKKRLVIVLTALSTIILLAWLRPRVFDETLLFHPTPLPEGTFTGAEWRKLKRESQEDTTFFARAESTNTIRRLIDSRDLMGYQLGLVFINQSIQKGGTIPEEFRNINFLRSKLVDCLKADLNRIYYAIEKQPYGDYCYEWGNCNDQKTPMLKIVFRLLKEFTFQKNKTLNQYWMKILEFEKSGDGRLSINSDLTTFNTGNFYGECFLVICIPSVEQTVKLIETISAQPNDTTDPCSPLAPGFGGR